MDNATCKVCGRHYQMVHNEDELTQEEIENIEETGHCSHCSQE